MSGKSKKLIEETLEGRIAPLRKTLLEAQETVRIVEAQIKVLEATRDDLVGSADDED